MAYRVLQFAGVINRYDFIDNVIRYASPAKFHMMACTLQARSTIEPPGYDADGIPHLVLNVGRRREYPRAIVRLARHLRRERVDIIHTHHFDEAFIGVVAARLSTHSRPVVARHYHDEVYLLTKGLKRRAMLRLEGFCYRRAVAMTTPSPQIKRLLVECQQVPAEKISAMPLPFDFSAARYADCEDHEARRLRSELGLEDHFVIGNFGRHHPLKGQAYLLRAFAVLARDYPRVRLLMVGDGPHHQALRALARDLGVEANVVFTGWRRDAAKLMSAVDVVAHPSLHEAFSQMMVEALVHRRPLVITRVAGPMDYMEDGRTAILIPPRDVDSLCDALRWVMKHPEESRQMAEQGRDYVLREFSVQKIVPLYEAFYEAIINAGR